MAVLAREDVSSERLGRTGAALGAVVAATALAGKTWATTVVVLATMGAVAAGMIGAWRVWGRARVPTSTLVSRADAAPPAAEPPDAP